MIDCVNYIITHCYYPIAQDDLYKTLCVGSFRKDGLLSDQDGESISGYNPMLNEITGLYWIWKNTHSDYVGMCHYRRNFFNYRFDGDLSRMDAERVEEILCDNGYDMILTRPVILDWSVYYNIEIIVGSELMNHAYEVFADEIKDKQPDYIDAYENVLNSNHLHVCNMFVTRREILNKYCEWLFSFLTDATDRIDVSNITGYPKRVSGYFAEMLLNVWIEKQDYKIFTLPHTGRI